MDGWYYKLFDSEFGPVKFDELVSLAKNNTLSRSDQVRFGESGLWRAAGSIGNLMAHFPFQAVEKVISVSTMTPPSESFVIDDADEQLSIDDFAISESSEAISVVNEVQVRAPVQSQPRTTAHKAKVTAPVQSSRSVEERSAPERPREERSRDIAPPAGQKSKSDSRWWCMIKDKEYGPIDLKKLIDWASTGRLHRHDYVRYGLEAYVRADELPQLFPKLPNQPEETEEVVEAAKPSKPEDLMDFLTGAPSVPSTPKRPAAVAAPAMPVAPRPAPPPAPMMPSAPPPPAALSQGLAASGLGGSSSSSMGAGAASFGGSSSVRASAPPRPAPKKSSGPGIGAMLMSPAVLGGVAGLGAIVGLYFLVTGLGLLASADVGRVKEMAAVVKEISTARGKSKVSSDDMKPLADKAGTIGKKYGMELKGTKDKKSKKVLALANALEELSGLDLGKPSDEEKKADAAMSKVKSALAGAKQAAGVK